MQPPVRHADDLVAMCGSGKTLAARYLEMLMVRLAELTTAADDDQPGLLFLGKGAALAQSVARLLAAAWDEWEQRPTRDAGETPAAPLIGGRLHRPGAHDAGA